MSCGTTHYEGCECHEAKRNGLITDLEAELAKAREERDEAEKKLKRADWLCFPENRQFFMDECLKDAKEQAAEIESLRAQLQASELGAAELRGALSDLKASVTETACVPETSAHPFWSCVRRAEHALSSNPAGRELLVRLEVYREALELARKRILERTISAYPGTEEHKSYENAYAVVNAALDGTEVRRRMERLP